MIIETLLALKTINDLHTSNKNYEKVEKHNDESFKNLSESKEKLIISRDIMENELQKLATRRETVYKNTIPFFIKVMHPLKKVNLLTEEERGVCNSLVDQVEEFNNISSQMNISGIRTSKNPTINIFLLFGSLGYASLKKKHSEGLLRQSNIIAKEVDAYIANINTTIEYLNYISKQAKIMNELSLRFNLMLIRTLKNFSKIVDKNGCDKSLYTFEERQLMRLCFNLMITLKNLTTTTVFENDELSRAFIQAIINGTRELSKIDELIKNQQNFIANQKLF